ncbi:MAG: hypothetical protein IPF67_19255 [Saprospiraceae bacterium]|nr:hypothetical protein [Candidatus Brachybacter algidus]
MDILTQRLSPVLGPLLRGCDEIAADGLKHEYLTSVTKIQLFIVIEVLEQVFYVKV